MNANSLHHKLLITSVAFFPWLCWPAGQDDDHETPENESATMEASTAVSLPTDTSLSLSEQVRIIITPDCGSCHTSTLMTAKASAVRVFDLARETWASTMSPEQLESFGRRLRKLTEPARKKVEVFVEEELKRRGQSQ